LDRQIAVLFSTVQKLLAAPEPPKKYPIGFGSNPKRLGVYRLREFLPEQVRLLLAEHRVRLKTAYKRDRRAPILWHVKT